MITYGGSGGIPPPFLTLTLDGGKRAFLCPDRFTLGETAVSPQYQFDRGAG
jgi:hypothetical protein